LIALKDIIYTLISYPSTPKSAVEHTPYSTSSDIMVRPNKPQTNNAAAAPDLHDTNNNEHTPETSGEWSDLTSIDSLENDLTERFLDDIQKNWNITRIEDMIAANTWLKRVGKGDSFEYDTIEAFHKLSILTKGKAPQIKTKLTTMWGRRDKNHGGFTKGIGKDWATKQRNMRTDVEELIKEARNWVEEGNENDDQQEEEEEEETTGEKNTKKKPERNIRSSTRRATAPDIPSQVPDEATPNAQIEDNNDTPTSPTSDLQIPNSSPPNSALSPPRATLRLTNPPPPLTHKRRQTNITLPKSHLQHSWSLSDPNCTDALPADLRSHSSWQGPIEHWGTEHGHVLQELCKLAGTTRGRHAEVVEYLRELVGIARGGRAGGNARGLEMEELRVAGEWFRGAGVVDVGNGDGEGHRVSVSVGGGNSSMNVERRNAEMEVSHALGRHRVKEAVVSVVKYKRDIAHLEGNASSLELAKADRAVGEAEREVAKAWVVVREKKRVLLELQGRGHGEDE
jgi:hypothetical protein